MATNYLQVTPVSGKWYVSERVRTRTTRWQVLDPAQEPPRKVPSEMIVAGPFDSRQLAKDWDELTNAAGYIWSQG